MGWGLGIGDWRLEIEIGIGLCALPCGRGEVSRVGPFGSGGSFLGLGLAVRRDRLAMLRCEQVVLW